MAISTELEAQILRYHYVEKWRIGTIARHLCVHHSVVRRVLFQTQVPMTKPTRRATLLERFLPFVRTTLEKFPKLTASRLYQMVVERGYLGGPDHFRSLVALHRPRPVAEAYLRLRTLPGEQAQVDWGHFGYITLGKAKRPLMAFVMVLSYSRKIFLRFYLNQQMANFLRGHEAAFEAWQGLPRVLLYDNLKSAVLERQGDAIRFNPKLLAFAGHYRYEPRPVAVARGNEKGRVERAIRYIRDNFFAARSWKDLDDLNAQALAWCEGPAANRPCPEDNTYSVRAIFEQEQPSLMALPSNPYATEERIEVKVGKTPYVRFDLNDYSVPHTHVCRMLTVEAQPDRVTILDGGLIIAHHLRSYEKGRQIEDPAHIRELVERKGHARLHRGQDRLTHAIPIAMDLLKKAAERGYVLGPITARLLRYLDRYGTAELESAITEALIQDAPHPNTVHAILEMNRELREETPPAHMELPDDPRVRNMVVRPHNLNTYDQLNGNIKETQDVK